MRRGEEPEREGGAGGRMGAAHRSRRREVKKAAWIKEQGFLAAVTVEEEMGREGGEKREDEV